MPDPETVFITKYALTDGIREVAVTARFNDGRTVRARWPGQNGWQLFHSDEWHDTRAAAVLRAETMREAKVASHERSIVKLRKLSFAEPS